MSAEAIRIHAFNNMLKDLLEYISKKFPQDKDVTYARSQIELALTLSSITSIRSFMSCAQPYLSEIYNKDEHFFLDIAKTDSTLNCMHLGDKWKDLDDNDKDTIWKKLQKMVVLGNKIVG